MRVYTTMGDPHLGRVFKTGVPLHRRGDREAMVWDQFERELLEVDTSLHVNMGDLFDKFVVTPAVVLRAFQIYEKAARTNPNTTYVVIEGNHDRSKDGDKRSSFDLFAQMVRRIDNIIVVQETPEIIEDFAFVPYHPFRPTAELVAELPDDIETIFGHWDIQDWGGGNVIPTKLLAEKGITRAISGHDHLARIEERHGVQIIVTGSMQPYTHAEDQTGAFYVTTTLEELEKFDVTDLNVRVLLREGETLPEDLDCLSLTAKRQEAETVEVDTSDFDTLDLGDMLARALDGLSVKDQLMEAFRDA